MLLKTDVLNVLNHKPNIPSLSFIFESIRGCQSCSDFPAVLIWWVWEEFLLPYSSLVSCGLTLDCIYSWIACLAFMFECGIMVLHNSLHVYSAHQRMLTGWMWWLLVCCSEMMATLQWTKGTLFIWYNSWSCYCLVILNTVSNTRTA